jgi:HSP20 family protein
MSNLPSQRPRRSFLPAISELFSDFPSWIGLHPMFESHVIRLEDEMEDGHYVVRAELPGIDPAKDLDITVRDGRLTIKVERTEK